MEGFEEECMQLRKRVSELEQRENDNKIKCDMATRDKEDIKKKMQSKEKEQQQNTLKEEELQQKLDDMQRTIREKEQVTESKV